MLNKILKTTVFAVLAISLTNCYDNAISDILPLSDNAINFSTYVANAETSRGAVTTITSIQDVNGFGVLGYLTGNETYINATSTPNYMYNQQVVYTNGKWTYTPIKYWPNDADSKVSFFAYAPYSEKSSDNPIMDSLDESAITAISSNTSTNHPCLNFSLGSDISKHIDLVYASAIDKTNKDGIVSFEFKHALCRVGFKITAWEDQDNSIFDDNTTVTINAITIATKRKGATLDLYSGIWDKPVDTENYAFTLTGDLLQNNILKASDIQGQQINTQNGYLMLLPDLSYDGQSECYAILVDFTVETIDDALNSGKIVTRNKVYNYLTPGFVAGKAYDINIHLGLTGTGGGANYEPTSDDPLPVDPNPDDQTEPTMPGNGGYVKFSTTVVDWEDSENINIPVTPSTPEAPAATFTANQLNLHITGSFVYNDPSEAPEVNTVTLMSMVKEGTTENILKGEQSFTVGSFSIPISNLKLGKLESDVKYILTLRNANGDIYTTGLTMQFGMMQMTLDIPAAGTVFTMPLKTGTTPTKIAFVWDDEAQTGELSSISTTNNTRTFLTPGLKRVKILSARSNSSSQPQMPEFNFNSYARDYSSLIYSLDTPILKTGQTDFSLAFRNCINLVSISDGLFDNNTTVTDFSNTFESCTSLQAIPAGLFDKTTKVTTFKHTFTECTSLTSIPAGIFSNNNDVKIFWGTFSNCTGITSLPENLFANKTKATSFQGTFGWSGIRTVPASTFANCTKAENFDSTFAGCDNLETVEEGVFDDLIKVTSFINLFRVCPSLKYIPETLFANCASATNFGSAFANCTSLQEIPEQLFYGCPEAKYFGTAFTYCSSLNSIPAELFSKSVNATTFGDTFSYCTGITSIPDGLFDNCTKATTFGSLFKGCTSLTYVPKNLFDNNFDPTSPKSNSVSYVFKDCSAITSELPELWNRTEIKYYTGAFDGCVNAANYADVPTTWR